MPEVFQAGSPRLIGIFAACAAVSASAAIAQNAQQQTPAEPTINSARSLRLPEAPQVFGQAMPSVIKATAIVNGDVITQTDVDQRLGLLIIANGSKVAPEELATLREQILRNLIDETLQIQAAKARDITVKPSEVDTAVKRVAANMKQSPEQLEAFLAANGSSMESMRRQIEGELAWQRLQRAEIESEVSVGEDEVKSVIDRMNASKGTEEYRIGEIYLPAIPGDEAQAIQNADRIIDQVRQGGSFSNYARQYSQASTAAVGGDLGWVRPEQLPGPIAGAIRQMSPGSISRPIQLPGGVSIIALVDSRRVLTADPRDAVLSLKQVSISFPAGTSRAAAEPQILKFAQAARNIGGCGGAERIAGEFHGEVVQSDQVRIRDLPPAVQEMMMPIQVGQSTQPFGSLEDGVRILVVCGRDEASNEAPSYDQVYNQLASDRLNIRAKRYLRDLRRDAVIEYR